MNVTTEFECQCKNKAKLKFKKPGLLQPVIIPYTCAMCSAGWILRYSQPQKKAGAQPMQLDLKMKRTN